MGVNSSSSVHCLLDFLLVLYCAEIFCNVVEIGISIKCLISKETCGDNFKIVKLLKS